MFLKIRHVFCHIHVHQALAQLLLLLFSFMAVGIHVLHYHHLLDYPLTRLLPHCHRMCEKVQDRNVHE